MTEADARALVVLIDGRRAGIATQGSDGRLAFSYDTAWYETRDPTPLSLSMPLGTTSHDDPIVRAFLWGLLPDNERVLERWGHENQVSPRNPFALLRHVGEDCAGAVQLVAPDRVDAVASGKGEVEWLGDAEVAARLRTLRRDPTAWHATSTGQFSLAGAQAKTALYREPTDGRWGSPHGAVPTTHILKPAVQGFDDHDLNEHLCLEVVRRLGIPAAASQVVSFEDERAIVVERYDRARTADGELRRIHQEDMCQALAVLPTGKYQNEGGPSPEQIVRLLRATVRPESAAAESTGWFVDALALSWILGGTDAHAKNYSVLLGGSQVRLAPLYDVASALPYEGMYLPKLKLAMRFGGEYRLDRIGQRHWRRLATGLDMDADATVSRVHHLAEQVPEQLAVAASAPSVRSLDTDLPDRLVDAVAAWAVQCRRSLET